MGLADIDAETVRITGNCLRAAADGPFFPDWEFESLIGLDRDAVREVAQAWPERASAPDQFRAAVLNSMNNLLWYPHGQDEALDRYVAGGQDDIRAAVEKLIAAGF